MVIVQVDDLQEVDKRVNDLGVRKVWETDTPEAKAFHLHPKDVGAAILSFDQMDPPASWKWAGEGWETRTAAHVSEITGVDLQAADPAALAHRWSELFARPVEKEGERLVVRLDRGNVNFLEDTDGRGDGVSGVEFAASDLSAIHVATEQLGLTWRGNEVMLCGTWFRFLQEA
ncbi:MAG: hypothetical protein HUJ31_12750 [Pseudomonadales bacterium]|nr:hypothetical protein [Pseudomonadales bacterium]